MVRLSELTGFAEGPPIEAAPAVLDRMQRLGEPLGVDVLPLVTERAEIWSYSRNGRISCGGATRLLRTADGWMALSLARPDDEDLVPAWIDSTADWESIEARVASAASEDLVARGRLLGLPVAALSERAAPPEPSLAEHVGAAPPLDRSPVVVDLSSLWAGPLCTQLLRARDARVVKVEARTRPDGARRGPAEFFERMNGGKEQVTVEFTSSALLELIASADVVVESSRPRALEQLGIDARELLTSGPRVWLSITAHGRTSPQRDWVGFGDDAAVAGGLVAWWRDTPCFLGDAIADPLTGVAAATAVAAALDAGGRWLIDCNLSGVAAYVAGQ